MAYSALNKPQIYGGPAKLHCYQKQLDPILEQMNGNSKLTATENVILRDLRNSYVILTDKRNSCVFLKRNTEISDTNTDEWIRNAGN